LHRDAAERVLHIAISAFAAQIVALLVIDVVADLLVLGVVQSLQDVLNLLQMVPLVLAFVLHRIERRVHLDADDVAQLAIGIDQSLAAIARVVKHYYRPPGPVLVNACSVEAPPRRSS
jgi:hypothetical protein